MSIKVLIADDHSVVREGLRGVIGAEPGLEVVGEARDGVEVVLKARALHPDVIILDLKMPRRNGLEAILELKREDPGVRILVLTSYADDELIMPALKNGALGYLLKDSSPQELLDAIRHVAGGESSLHPAIARKLIRELHQPNASQQNVEPLTEREIDVLRLMGLGYPNERIAEDLAISERTVRTHVSNILNKLHLANRTQAALYALREGLVGPESEP